MSALFSLIPGRLLAEAAIVGVLAGLLWISHAEVSHLEVRLAAAQAATEAAQAAYANEAAAVATQAKALQAWRDVAEQADRDRQSALVEAIAARAALAVNQTRRKTEEATDAKLPACAQLLGMDLGLVCPAHARWLHDDGH